ncbi:hypothetical protein ACWT_2727 [Actinoplanes sp. SE50]|uniref:DUF6401 family natural product biosynthesis protein n=1 Tax=unclassified Actinoplanes TaxID=2626549 RepID=UPI00023EC94C|nr:MULTISPECIES: DUF6401 family natural product biosynthesis protein [unclassified Actinoplanes]AEV83714.1 hypothetical protein ACPL_2819 [Actinoplanes sp. SE50/110]ATO82142.1 hypothetical protein ACWT_2727 [Actinoplanes sp. SE50]SLL99549.1 hypothetical protein ACSP50_2780 [Actinoplanes sp. SE50/110]
MESDRQVMTAGARLALARWERRLGVPESPEPGLVALLDRHAARIRDSVSGMTVANLAAYADGVADTAAARGWTHPDAGADWRAASWPSLHLLAVCLLARSLP